MVGGTCESSLKAVREAFAETIGDHEGAAVAVHLGGKLVVDLWGGMADPRTSTPWQADTLVLVFSATKGLTATCALLLCENGRLELDAPICRVWPEFGRKGKSAVTLRHVLTHSAGLPAVDQRLTFDACHVPGLVAGHLAAQEPRWRPGGDHGYHALTFGWLVDEVVRRATGRTVGDVLASLARENDLECYIGLPPELEPRVAPLQPLRFDVEATPDPDAAAFITALFDPMSLPFQVFSNPEGQLDLDRYNAPALHQAEWPAVNGVATARSLATIYGLLLSDRLLSGPLRDEAFSPQVDGFDRVLMTRTTYGLGYSLALRHHPCGLFATTAGHEGAGGVVAFAEYGHDFGFAYVSNGPTTSVGLDRRSLAVLRALYASLPAA